MLLQNIYSNLHSLIYSEEQLSDRVGKETRRGMQVGYPLEGRTHRSNGLMKLNSYNLNQAMKTLSKIIVLVILLQAVTALTGIGLNPIRPLKLNKGSSTKYMFFINPETEILNKAQLKVTFPSEFDKTAIAARLSCLSSSLSYAWTSVPCIYSDGSVILTLGTVKNEETTVLISQPNNPTIYQMSSYFSLCLMVDSMTTTCDKTFGKVVFPESPILNTPTPTALYPAVSSLNTRVVGQSSTYEFRFSFSTSYGSGNTVRITFPAGFQTSSNPICQVSGTYNQVITTFVWPDKRTVECQNINKTLHLNETLKIVGILNPNYAGTFGAPSSPFIIELLKGTTTIVLEEISALQTVAIAAGTMTGSVTQANNFINADVQYTFYLNLLNSLTSSNFILIKFDNSWILYQENCRVISGITMAPSTSLVCSNYTQGSDVFLNVSNFLSASVSNQLVFTVKVRSPSTPATYSVGIQTANAEGVLDSMTTSVSLNSTYGDYKMLSINAIVAQSDVPVSGTGPLELTFFLNYDLPQTNVLTSGYFKLKIFPQIPLPPPLINGVLKCYFFNTIPAQTCTWDTSANTSYTLVTINTPLNFNFQYSQIPITITTEGAVNSSKIGITIADIVTRYRFQLQAFMHNNTNIPTEVYFSEYIAAPIDLPLTSYALSKEVNEKTHLRFEFTSPYNFVSPLSDDLRIKIQFLAGGAWAENLGYQPNQIYKRFPCVYSDNSVQTLPPVYNSEVSCDLYTHLTGPHASLTKSTSRGPYLLVSGFTKQMLVNTSVRFEVGGLKIGSSNNLQAKIRFSLVQETPTMLTKYVELYYKEFSLFTTAAQNVITPATTGVTDTLADPLINTVNNHTIVYTAPANFFAAIYEFDQISTPSFPSQFVSCSRVSALIANWCTYLGYPVNTVVEYSQSGTFSTSVSSVINITSGVYSGSFSALVRVMSATSITLMKTSFTVVYTPRPITSISFYNSETYIYKGSEHYYTLDFYPITSTPGNGFIRLKLTNYGNFGENPFCSTTSLTPIVSELEVQCTVESPTSLKIYNIMGLTAGNLVRIRLRILSTLDSSTSFRPQITVHTHYSLLADPSIVDSITNYNLDSAVTNYHTKPNEFQIANPRVTLETPRVNYVGPFELLFNPSTSVLTAHSIKLILNNHAWNGGIWTTPNSVTSDPLVCMINHIRVACTYTLSPLTVIMDVSPAGITAGQNNLITLDTEYLSPSNGIKHPSQGGHYNLYLQFLDSTPAIIQQQSFYQEVLPPRLRNFYVNSSVNDVGVENMFYAQLELSSTILNAFNHATLYSRIFIEFPTKDAQGNDLFAANLGGYQKTGDLVGCVFDTWNTYYVDPVGGYRLQCRLIMSEAPGEPTRVQVLHHGAFSSSWRYMRFWMAKIFNPNRAVTSVPISIRMEHVQVSTNNVYQLYYDTFDVFMNSQTAATPTVNSRACNYYDSTVLVSGPINHEGYFRFYPRSIGGFNSNYGYFFVIDMTDDFKPSSLQTRAGNNYCHGSYFFNCLSFPDINYIVIHSNSDSYYVNMYVNFGPAISQGTTILKAKVWSSYRDIGYTNLQMTSTCWNQIRSGPSSLSIAATSGNGYGYYLNKRRLEVVVTFTVEEPVPTTGSIEIKFPPSVPRIYPHCRSMTNLGSAVAAQGTSENGQIGCLVQNIRSWVITGFNALVVGDVVKIVGEIDLPGSSGNLGAGYIMTYNNTHPTDIFTNGFIIDYYYDTTFFLSINNDAAQNVDSAITLEETLPLRTGYTGPLRFKFKLSSALNGPNAGKITVRVPSISTLKVAGGFVYNSANKYVCQIVEISTFQETGCIVTSVTQDTTITFPNFLFTVITSGTLTANTLYKLVLTTHNGVQPEGLTFPTVAGTYKVDVNFDVTGSSSAAIHNHLYLQVYGTKFAYILCHQFNSIPSRKNLIWLKITPTTTIQVTQQIILEIPTKSSQGAPLFADDLGTGLADGAVFPIDILATPFSTGFMSCRLFHGDGTYYQPAKIVCGDLQGTITSSQVLWWAIKIQNPALPSGFTKLSVPFFLYSVEQGTTYKTNFDVIENAVYLRADYASQNDVATPRSSSQQLQTSGGFLDMITRNYYTLEVGQYYLIFFNFPLRNNGVVTNGCSYPGSSIYGDAIYHLNLWAIVCQATSTAIGVPGGGATTRNLRISGFFTPFYFLSSSEQAMESYGYDFNDRYTSSGGISDGYPNEGPKTSATPSLTITPVSGSYIAGTRDDYTFSFTFSASNNDLSFVKKIALIFPSGSIDYDFLESDCVEAPGSQVQVAECFLDTANEVIWIRPVEKSTYTSDMSVAITTRGLAIRNPVSNYNVNKNSFVIKYYTWQNITEPALSPTVNNNYCYLMINNLASAPFSYSPNPSPYYVPTFSYLEYPHQRYYTDTPFSSVVHRAPFQLEFYPAVTFNAQSGSNWNYIKVAFPSTFGDAAMFKIRDLQVFRPVCYLNNQRIRQCSIDTTANEITMSFLFALSTATKYHLKMSILDSRNADIDGFLATAAVSNIVLLYKPYGASTWSYTETDQFPTLYSLPTGAETGPFRGIIAGTADYGHTVPNQLNYLNLLLTFNRTDITGLVFEFPSIDNNGNVLFNNDNDLAATFLNQQNGGSYPCGNHGFSAGGKARCLLLKGSSQQGGLPTRVIMSEFTYVTQMNCRLVFKTPLNNGVWVSVKVKAYGGQSSASNPYGNQYMGQWQFNEIFQVNTGGLATGHTYTANYQQCPSLSPWRNNTDIYVFSQDTILNGYRTSVAEVLYYDESSAMTDKLFCQPSLGSSNDYEDLLTMTISASGVEKRYAYLIRTKTSSTNSSTTTTYGWTLQYLKCKHYSGFSITAYFYFGDTSIEVATNTFSSSYCTGYTSGIDSPVLKQFSQSHHANNGTDVTYLQEFDVTPTIDSISNFNFRNGDQMVLSIKYQSNFWGTINSCTLLGGIASTSLTNSATCVVGSNTNIYIKNVGGFIANPALASSTRYRVKVKFTASGGGNTNNVGYNFYMYLFANFDAYNGNFQPIFEEYNGLTTSGTLSSCYWQDDSTCVLLESTATLGTFLLQKITDTYLQVVFKPSGNLNFGASTSYTHLFLINFNGFTYGTSCSISDLTMEMSTSSTPGNGYNNTFPATLACDDDFAKITLSGRQWNQFWGGLGPASDNQWQTNEYLIMYITIAPNAATSDLSNLQHDYIFVEGSYSYKTTGGWTNNIYASLEYTPQALADSATLSTLTNSRGAATELSFSLSNLKTDLGPLNNNYYLLAEFIGSAGWTSGNDPFTYTNQGINNDYLACKCIAGTSPLTISTSSPIIDTTCKRRLPSGTFTNYAILIGASASATQDLICFLPEFTISAGMSFSVQFKLIYEDNYPNERTSGSTVYSSVFRVSSNNLDFTALTPNMNTTYVSGFSSSEGTNFYASTTNVGSTFTGTYSLSGDWGTNFNTPYIYIYFKKAGPIPIQSFCSDTNTYLQCRVYTDRLYLIVAQLKSTSVRSYSITNAGTPLKYPPSQYSVTSAYGATIYVGSGSWSRSSSLGRSKSSLAPVSTNSFLVFSDIYGSKRASYGTNIFFSVNPAGQTLFNYAQTGSKMIISWSSLTTGQNCQVWVESEPTVELYCDVSGSSLIVTSPYYDYTTSNNIMISLGLTNPTSASTNFDLLLYSYYYSSSIYELTISRSATYTTDITYTSGTYTLVSKQSVIMYPFQSRISTVANAPLRIRFRLPSSTVSNAWGQFTLSYSQIGYTTAHLCYMLAYPSYTAMMQQTQRSTYKVSCTSSSSTLTIIPSVTLTVSSGSYYELVMVPLNINSAGCTALGCVTQSGYQQTNFDAANFVAYNNRSSPNIISQQSQKLYSYEGASRIGLQQIYILCVQPRTTSLYLSININFTSSYDFPSHYLEVSLYDLSLTQFSGYSAGDIFPCQLSSNFLAVSARKKPQCRVVLADKLHGWVRIRIQNIGYLIPTTYWVSLDDILLPTPSSADNNNKFDVSISYRGPSNLKYQNYFPEIFQVDNTNSTSPVTTSTYTFNNPAYTGFGNQVTGQITFTWPFDSSSSSYESKLALNFRGGYSAVWRDIDALTFLDATVGTYQLLWVNKALKKFVFLLPNKGSGGSTTLNLTGLNNPYPYQREDYNSNTDATINFYNNHFLQNSRTFGQPGFIFTMNPSLVFVNQNTPSNQIDNYPSTNTIAPSSTHFLTLSLQFSETQTNLQARNLNTIRIQFTSGVSFIRECRVMRNDSTWVNTMTTCQPKHDGTNWNVYLYDVANSQLNKGWWVQILANYTSASLSYTSYVMCPANSVVQYQNSYTVAIGSYNTSRSIPSVLSWLDNRYVLFYHETQHRFLDAVTNQRTPYLRFRFKQTRSCSTSSDRMYIYLPDDLAQQPYTPVNNNNHLVVQFLPALSPGDSDFSVGFFSDGYLKSSGGAYYYDIYMRYGGIVSGGDYMMMISEYNTATSSFYMSQSPNRQKIDWLYQYYPSYYDWRYYDTFYIQSYTRFRSVQLLHTTTTVGDYDTLTIKYKPYGALSAYSTTREIGLRLSVMARYSQEDGGVAAIYASDGKTIISGSQYTGKVLNANNNQIYTIQYAQHSIENAPLRFVLAKQSAYSDNTEYTWIIPLIKNPATAYVSLRYNLTLVCSPTSGYQYIHNHYESINQYYTVADTSTTVTTSITNNLRAVQTNSNVDLAVNLGTISLQQYDTAVFKLNNALKGILPDITSPNDNSNYDYHYFPRLDMIVAQKKSINTITSVGIGSSSTAINYQSTFGLSWVWIYNSSNVPTATNPYTLYTSVPPTLTLTTLSSYSSASVTLREGYQLIGSSAYYQATFTSPIINQTGQIRLLFDKTKFEPEVLDSCRAGAGVVRSSSDSIALRCYRTSEGFRLVGFAEIAATTSVNMFFKLKALTSVSSSPISLDIFGHYEDNSTRVSLAQVSTITIGASAVLPSLKKVESMVTPYWATLHSNNYYEIEGVFNLRDTKIFNGDYFYISEPGWSLSGNRRLIIKQNSSVDTEWTELDGYYVSSNRYRFEMPDDHLILQAVDINTQFVFRYRSYYADSGNGWWNGFVVGGPGRHRFYIQSYDNAAGNYKETGYFDFVPFPRPFTLTVTNRYPAAGRQTMLDLYFTVDYDLPTGTDIVIRFDTNNLLAQMFQDDLEGAGANGLTHRYLDCNERKGYNEISGSDDKIVCLLQFGNRYANPPQPANLTITTNKIIYGWSSSDNINILIANVKNPTTVGMNTGITLSGNIACESQQNLPCSAYEARGYYVTSAATENSIVTATSFTSSSNLVLATGLTHTFTLTLATSITTTDAIYIVYPENFQGVMPGDCTVSGYTCYVFPTRRWVVLLPSGLISSGAKTLSITSMNNGYYSKAYSTYFKVTVARGSAVGDVYLIDQPAFTPVSYSFADSNVATAVRVQTTQTPDMYLRNYANTVIFTIQNAFSDSRTKAIYIKAPAEVTSWDPSYCNATITNTSNFNYPLRFICQVDPDPAFLRLTLDEDMGTFSSGWATMTIRLHAKFTLADFPSTPSLYQDSPVNSGNFVVYSSVNATSSSSLYYMSQCSEPVSIIQHQVPVISVINFNTQSFANRLARVNNKEVFYLLFKPLVDVTLGKIVFTIPSEFNYPGVFSLDNCLMIGRTTKTQTSCQLSRYQGQTLVTLTPELYDNNVKIFQIGSVDTINWFTAPGLPGDFYQMNVAVYDSNGTLVSKQTRNISPVYGESFDIPSMTIKNVQDKSTTFATYDLRFVTGNLQIPPGATTTATTQTSELEFVFENFNGMNPTNVFSNDLGTGLSSGSEIGCIIFNGLAALPGKRIKCLLKVGTSETNKPTIRVINYNFINPATTIILSFARIQTLPGVLVNTISIGVKIFYNDIGSSTYLYIPTSIITVPTNSSNVLANTDDTWENQWYMTASYSGTNIVLQPTTFTYGLGIPWCYIGIFGGLSSQNCTGCYQYSYSSTGAEDEFILLTFYPPTLLDKNNPVTVTCSSCTEVQVFYAAGMVKFKHSQSKGPTSYTSYLYFTFNNFPTSAYALLNEQIYVYAQVFDSYQCIVYKNISVSLTRTVEKCTKFNFGVVSVSSLNGGQIGVTYLFSIKTNHFVPSNGALSITLPIEYGNMVTNQATCELIGFTGTNCYCRIATPSRVDIYSNGTELSSSTTYSVKITGLQNPNVDSSNFVFIVTSYYEQNIYLAKKICENSIVPPTINVKPLRTCSLSWTPQYYNQKFNASYVFQLSCSDVFRGDSMLYLSLPSSYATTNPVGTVPCSSYESTTLVAPTCTLSSVNNVFTLSTSIDASSQSALSILVNLVNPINGTYSASAYVTSKGTQYASASASSIIILSNSYLTAPTKSVELLNTPKEAGLSSTYIFKVSPVSGFTPSNMGITFPSNFYVDASKLTVAIANSPLYNLFSYLTYNNIQALISNASAVSNTWISAYPSFSVTGTSIYLQDIAKQVSSTSWSYVFISGVHNPSQYAQADFTVAYYLISQGFQALQWAYKGPLTYYISPPPQYIAIDKVAVSDYDLLYPANYTFTFSASSFIAKAGRNLSYIVVIPTFYKSILWANTKPTCKFAQLAVPSSCYSYQGEVIVTQAFPANYTSLTLTVSTLLNPSLATNCATTDTTVLAQTFFIIRIIDTLSNSFLYQSSSVVDSKNCLTFSVIRIPISLEYPLVMTAGLAYNITYGLTKPSSNLKISASVDSPGFTFSPEIVDFNNYYTLSKSTQVFLRSDVSAGTYVLKFTKSEATTQTYFRNILPVTVTVKEASNAAATSSPTISIPTMTDSTIGYPVIIPVKFSIPSSTEMTMFLTISEESTQTLAQYSSYLANFTITPRIINIMPQTTSYNFTITQGMRVVPPPLTLNFKITSNYPIVHQLTTPTMYLCFDRDPKHNVLYPPLRVTLTPFLSSCNQQDVGRPVTNIMISNATSESSAGSVTPKIIDITVLSAASTGASLKISSLTSGKVYYLCIPEGYATVTNPSVLVAMNSAIGKTGVSTSTALTVASGSTAQVNYYTTVNVTGLSQSSIYVFYAVSSSNLGTSPIFSIKFNTSTLSNGAQMTLYFSDIVQTLDLVNSLVQVLRIAPTRVKILTSIYKLQQKQAAITSTDNKIKYGYDIVIAPDPTNDIITPLDIVSGFANTPATLDTFSSYISSFDRSQPIKYFELMPVLPIVVTMPYPVVIKLYSATFKMKFKSQATMYAVLYENIGAGSSSLTVSEKPINAVLVKNLSAADRKVAPSSNQIIAGTDYTNTPLGTYKVFKLNTDQNGMGTISWQDLKSQSVYQVFLTAAVPRPYDPPMVWPDEQVIAFNFSTLPNPNVGSSDKQKEAIREFSKYNPKLADAMSRFVELNSRKTTTTSKP